MDSLFLEIGARMRAFRLTVRKTQAQVAEAAGIDASFYGQLERGQNVPSVKTLLAIARSLGVDPGSFLPGRGTPADPYAGAVERLLAGLGPRQRKLVLGMAGDMAERLRKQRPRSPPEH